MTADSKTYKLIEKGRLGIIALVVGVVGLAASALGWVSEPERFYHAFLTAFVFWTSIALGGLFFTMMHHLTGARWSVVVRRICENLMMQLPWLFLAFIPVYFGIHDLYHWSHTEAVAADHALQGKAAYLNVGFFTIRTVAYFAIWSILAVLLYRVSLKQDAGHKPEHLKSMRKISAIGMLLFAATITLSGWDWLMSLEPHWFSTVFGVYLFSGSFLNAVAVVTGVCLYLRKEDALRNTFTLEHFHDLGKLMLAFTIFWGYIGFAQYFLIWYGNLPEETFWYTARWEGSWKIVSLVLLFGHFALPFVILLFRNVKRSLPIMGFLGIWFLVMHWLDYYWLIYPTFTEQGASIGGLEIAAVLGLGGIFIWQLWRRIGSSPVVPVGDPELDNSINFVNN
ncbi:MAG: hypothetical protein GY867_11845 [bacterium]|nr:hypothetical protein [bacterium]